MTKKKVKKLKQSYYYDACTLDWSKKTYKEIFNGRKSRKACISHLSIGEAYGNSMNKGTEATEVFIELMSKLQKNKCVQVVGNDVKKNVLEMVNKIFTKLETADTLHLATALHNNCGLVRSIDGDLHGLDRKKVRKLGKEFGVDDFSVSNKNI